MCTSCDQCAVGISVLLHCALTVCQCIYGVQDAMETAAQSADPEIAEELLHFFVENNERECFAASLYTCYDLIKPDVALEVSRIGFLLDPLYCCIESWRS